MPAYSKSDACLTTEHGGAVDHTVDPSSGGVISLKVHLELHEEHGNASVWRDQRRNSFSPVSFTTNCNYSSKTVNYSIFVGVLSFREHVVCFFKKQFV